MFSHFGSSLLPPPVTLVAGESSRAARVLGGGGVGGRPLKRGTWVPSSSRHKTKAIARL